MLTAECDERDARRRIRLVHEAKFPRTKRLADFDHTRIPDLPPAVLGHLASGGWIDKGEPLMLLGDSGTGKTHLLIALGTIAAEQGRRVRYLTCAQLVNELAEAADDKQLTRVLGPLRPLGPALPSTRSATSPWTRAAPNCCSRSSPPKKNAPPSPAPPTRPSQRMGQHLPRPPTTRRRRRTRLSFNAHIYQTGTNSYWLTSTRNKNEPPRVQWRLGSAI